MDFSRPIRMVTRQGCSQPHSPGWARVPLASFFPQILINLSYFSSNFTHFLPHFGSPGGRAAHPGRPWLRHCNKGFEFKFLDDNIILFHCGHLPANYA